MHGRCKKECSVAFKIRQNAFPVGDVPWTLTGELTILPGSPSRLGRGHLSPYPTSLRAFSASIVPHSALATRRMPFRASFFLGGGRVAPPQKKKYFRLELSLDTPLKKTNMALRVTFVHRRR